MKHRGRHGRDDRERVGVRLDWAFRGVWGPSLFFAAFFLYVCFRVQPSLLLHSRGPLFFFSHSFWKPFPARPGGLLEYVSAFVAQLDHFDWLGGLVLTLVCWLIFAVSRRIVEPAGNGCPCMILVLPLLPLLLILDKYQASVWTMALGVLVSLAAAYGWCLVPVTRVGVRLICCGTIAGAIGWAAGFWPCLSFASLAALTGFRQRPGFWPALGCQIAGWIPLLLLVLLAGSRRGSLLNPWGSMDQCLMAAAVFLLLPVIIVIRTILPQTADTAPVSQTRQRKNENSTVPARLWNSRGLREISAAILLSAGCAVVWLDFDEQEKLNAQIDCASWRGDYSLVPVLARQLKSIQPSTEVRLHFALWKDGKLLDNLFSFRAQSYPGLFPGLSQGVVACRSQVEPLLELGLINDAEHFGIEALENEGNRPDLLKPLAEINVLKGRPQAARIFLNVLSQVPFEGDWACARLQQLARDPGLRDDPLVSEVRPCLMTDDSAHTSMATGALLQNLLRANRHNRMAFEYLEAHYLLTLQLDPLADLLSRMDDSAGADIPRNCEEAILFYERSKNVQVELRGRKIRTETVERFQRFSEEASGPAAATPEGRAALARDFGDTYWFYFFTWTANQTARK